MVDVIGLQPLETCLHFAYNGHPRRTAPFEIVAHGEPDPGSLNDLRRDALQGVTHRVSDSPRLYTSAVSMKLIPLSMASFTIRVVSS
jgi:hypothetical protein